MIAYYYTSIERIDGMDVVIVFNYIIIIKFLSLNFFFTNRHSLLHVYSSACSALKLLGPLLLMTASIDDGGAGHNYNSASESDEFEPNNAPRSAQQRKRRRGGPERLLVFFLSGVHGFLLAFTSSMPASLLFPMRLFPLLDPFLAAPSVEKMRELASNISLRANAGTLYKFINRICGPSFNLFSLRAQAMNTTVHSIVANVLRYLRRQSSTLDIDNAGSRDRADAFIDESILSDVDRKTFQLQQSVYFTGAYFPNNPVIRFRYNYERDSGEGGEHADEEAAASDFCKGPESSST